MVQFLILCCCPYLILHNIQPIYLKLEAVYTVTRYSRPEYGRQQRAVFIRKKGIVLLASIKYSETDKSDSIKLDL